MKKSKSTIHIISTKSFQSELLSFYIEKELQLSCIIEKNPTTFSNSAASNGQSELVLWDCHDLTTPEIWTGLLSFSSLGKTESNISVALINLDNDVKFGVDALARGVKGIFYQGDSLQAFNKGVLAVLNGELWFSRETMSLSLLNAQELSKYSGGTKPASILTRRETEILTLIASGSDNTDISNSLYISPHTVKSHINNIYRKIKAPSRVQAVLWAAKNLNCN